MLAVRNASDPAEYVVELGDALTGKWGKRSLGKKVTPHSWSDYLDGLVATYRFFDFERANYPGRYHDISCSSGGRYILVKAELTIPNQKKSAHGTGCRAGIFIDKEDTRVTILFAGHHDDYKNFHKGDENSCFKRLTKELYPEISRLITT